MKLKKGQKMKRGLKKILKGDDTIKTALEAYEEFPDCIRNGPSKIELLIYIANEIKKEKQN